MELVVYVEDEGVASICNKNIDYIPETIHELHGERFGIEMQCRYEE